MHSLFINLVHGPMKVTSSEHAFHNLFDDGTMLPCKRKYLVSRGTNENVHWKDVVHLA